MSQEPGRDDRGLPTFREVLVASRKKVVGLRRQVCDALVIPRLHKPLPSKSRVLSSAAAVLVLVFGSGLVLDKIDPFGVSRATKQYSALIAARLQAPFYGSDNGNGRAQDHIAVVLINDETLRERQSSWPPRYSYHEEVLRRVLRQHPRAVYYDIFIDGGRDFDDSLQDARHALADELQASRTPDGQRVPLFFGIPRFDAPLALVKDHNATPLIAAWHGLGTDYPLLIEGGNTGISPAAGADKVDFPSVALALYRAACANLESGCQQPASLHNAAKNSDRLSVAWGASPPASATSLECTQPHPPPWQQAIGLAWDSFLSGVTPSRTDSERQRCPYTLTIFEHQLADDDIAALLQNRVVLVGTQVSGMADTTQSPVHSALPGVYLHAMALDNLMTWGNRYPSRSEAKGVAFALVLGFLISLGAALVFRFLARGQWLVLFGLAIAATACALFVPWYLLRQPPPDWLGAFALFSATLFGLKRYASSHMPVVGQPLVARGRLAKRPRTPRTLRFKRRKPSL